MKRVFYGTCKSLEGDVKKKVYVPDLDIIEDGFQFEEGDLLVVFFAQSNTVNEPSIVIYAQDPEQETSTTSDEGKFIKTLDVEAGLANCWQAGETLIFVYTQQDTSKPFYWELTDAAHATTKDYGNTKLFTITDDEDFVTSLTTEDKDWPNDVAMTPYMLKKFFELLQPKQSSQEEQEEEEIVDPLLSIGLCWKPSEYGAQYERQPLGTLSLRKDAEGVTIDYPIHKVVQDYLETFPVITHTGQLFNNGNGTDGEGGETDETANPFITKMVPDNLYFNNGNGLYYQNGEVSIPRFILNDGSNRIAIGSNTDDTLSGIYLAKPTDIDGNTIIRGTLNTKGAITAEGGNTISTAGNVMGGVVYEANQPLRERYSPLLFINTIVGPAHTIGAGKTAQHQMISAQTPAGYEPIGIIGYNINYAGSNVADGRFANLWECCISGPYIYYALSNVKSSGNITVNCNFVVLYRKVI